MGPWPRPDYSMPSFASSLNDLGVVYMLGTVLGIFVFGSVHLLASNFEFPTIAEYLLWKASALAVALLPVAWFALGLGCTTLHRQTSWSRADDVAFWVFVTLFTFPRLFLLVEAILSVYYLPPLLFAVTWASNIPRVG